MNRTERSTGIPRPPAALLAAFARRAARALPVLALALVLCLGAAPSAFALVEPTVSPKCFSKSHTSITLAGEVQPRELETSWSFQYGTAKGGPWPNPGPKGTISKAEAEALGGVGVAPVATELTGLTPEVRYYVHLTATNASGGKAEAEAIEEVSTGTGTERVMGCETAPLHSTPIITQIRSVASVSAGVEGLVDPNLNASAIPWHYEIAPPEAGHAPPENSSSWAAAAGAEGTISKTEAEAAPLRGPYPRAEAELTGLKSGTVYYVRLFAEDEPEPGVHKQATSGPTRFETSGPPTVETFAVHALHGEAVRVLGGVTPNNSGPNEIQTVTIGGAPTSGTFTLTFEGQTTAPIAFNATSGEVTSALAKLSSIGASNIRGSKSAGGHYTLEFCEGKASSGEPLLVADASGLTPSGTVGVTEAQAGFSYPTHYHFEYVSAEAFAASGWAQASSTPEKQIAGTSPVVVGEDLPELRADETYDYRIVATNTTPGNPVVDGADQSVTAPAPEAGGGEEPAGCSNEQFRTGLSAALPDCRAYEQVTPVNKEGAQEVFHYGPTFQGSGALVGEDGEHVMIGSPETNFQTGPGAGQSPYFFTRTGSGWSMLAASRQPETGVNKIEQSVLLNPDLTQFGFASYWQTSPASESPTDELKAGPPGGPYTLVTSVPRKQVREGLAMVAASEDFSKLILQLEDHTLLGSPTGTTSGEDLYEYSEGRLRQVNVLAHDAAIGSCGARIVKGEGEPKRRIGGGASRDAVSADGSRVFFEAVPGGECSAASHLYMREAATDRTLDIGPYTFAAANKQGTELLLEKRGGEETHEFSLYDTASMVATPVFSFVNNSFTAQVSVSEGFGAIYLAAGAALTPDAPPVASGHADLYRYDVPTKALHFLLQVEPGEDSFGGPSADGRYDYFAAISVLGVPAGRAGVPVPDRTQVYRYDNTNGVVQCMSCASSFDPEPRLAAHFGGFGASSGIFVDGAQGMPEVTSFSANGDYAFFDTPSALVPQDVDGEIETSGEGDKGEYAGAYSPSSDVYEWRREGLNGCVHVQGCVSLISSGLGGYKVMLLGTAHEGRDVFLSDFSQLLPTDNDAAGDIYDARIGGGFAVPAKRVECEGDACSTPASPPLDATPSSFTFAGAGNLAPAPAPGPVTLTVKKQAVKRCPRGRVLSHHRCVKRRARGGKRAKKGTTGRKTSRARSRIGGGR
jgi:hypothetical protein